MLTDKLLEYFHREINEFRVLYQQAQPKPWLLQKPDVIQFPINDICNAHCQMCNIWQQKKDYEITLADLEIAIVNPLFSEVRFVGINGGEPTLRKDLAQLVDVLFTRLPSLVGINVITNALNSDVVIARLSEVGKVVQSHGGTFDVMISLDGVGAVHDRVRGRPGNFVNAVKVIDFIQSSDMFSGRRLGCTIIKENVYGLHDLLEFAVKQNIYLKYRVGIPHQRLYTKNVREPFALSLADRYHIAIFLENLIRFYEKSPSQNDFYRSLIDQIVYNHPRIAGCDWQHRGVTLNSRGELLYCAVASKTLGSAITEDAEQLYYNNQDHLHDIIRNKCDSCLHDYTGIPRITEKAALKIYTRRWLGRVYRRVPVLAPAIRRLIRRANRPLLPLACYRQYLQRLRCLDLAKDLPKNLQPTMRSLRSTVEHNKVLICGWYGTETLGDKAILGGILQVLSEISPNIELHIASLEVFISQMTAEQLPELQGCLIHSLEEVHQHVRNMDLVVFGGGPLMSSIHYLVDMRAIFQKATQFGIPTIVAGCGVGPIHPFSPYIQSVRHILQLSSVRIFRDQESCNAARLLGIDTTHDKVAEDPAFTWLQAQVAYNGEPNQSQVPTNPYLLLGLRDWTYHEYGVSISTSDAQNVKDQFEQSVIVALHVLLAKYPDLKIIPFPMCTNHMGGDDRWFYRRLFRDHEAIQQSLDITFLESEISPQDAVRVFQSASVALVMRYHAMIFSLALDLPVVSIDYTLGQGKTKALASKFEIPHRSIDTIDSTFIVENLSKYLDSQRQRNYRQPEPLLFRDAMKDGLMSLLRGR